MRLHRHLFQDVYAWAGRPRSIRIAKGGNWFCYPENLDRFMNDVFASLAARDYLTGRSAEAFAAGAAEVLAEINAGHPFREGNGRTQLTFLKILALNAGFEFSDEVLDPHETLYAMVESFDRRLALLTDLIHRAVTG